ncbi:hypothetical protein GCM10027081_57790 [Cupriavidus yeoncheonensis]
MQPPDPKGKRGVIHALGRRLPTTTIYVYVNSIKESSQIIPVSDESVYCFVRRRGVYVPYVPRTSPPTKPDFCAATEHGRQRLQFSAGAGTDAADSRKRLRAARAGVGGRSPGGDVLPALSIGQAADQDAR